MLVGAKKITTILRIGNMRRFCNQARAISCVVLTLFQVSQLETHIQATIIMILTARLFKAKAQQI